MTDAGGQDQIAEWNGPSGQRWLANQALFDAMLAPFSEAAIAAAAPLPGERVLDVGCGAGATTLDLAARVGPAGHVLGVDVSAPLIERARERGPAGGGVAFLLGDAARVDLPEASFDLLFSRFGVMFFADPDAAFAHLRRALKPDGRIAFVCWRGFGENMFFRLPIEAAKGIVPPQIPVDPNAPGPFAFADAGRVERLLGGAGFAEIRIAPFDHAIPFSTGAGSAEAAIDEALDLAAQFGPLSRMLEGQPPAVRDRATAAVRDALKAHAGDAAARSVTLDGAAWIVTARAGARG